MRYLSNDPWLIFNPTITGTGSAADPGLTTATLACLFPPLVPPAACTNEVQVAPESGYLLRLQVENSLFPLNQFNWGS